MAKDIAKTLESLSGRKRAEFRALWLEYFGQELKNPSRRDVLIRLLAYRMQESTYGGLGAATRKRLRKLADEFEANPTSDIVDTPRIKPGTRLMREWRGEMHTVTATEDGFAYSGKPYKSLTEVARRITGTKWSGPRFFGLRGNSGPRERPHGK
jgi:hypothetical protein